MYCRNCGKKLKICDDRVKYCFECRCNQYGEVIKFENCMFCGEPIPYTGHRKRKMHQRCIYTMQSQEATSLRRHSRAGHIHMILK